MADIPEEFTDQDREVLTDQLQRMIEVGEAPFIPLNVDVDGDGRADAWTLDSFGALQLVPEIPLAHTSYTATGEDGF